MRKKKGTAQILFAAVLLAFVLAGCGRANDIPSPDEEISVKITLNLKEDIGLLLTAWEVNGHSGMSGSSNADRSMIKGNSTDYWSFNKEMLDAPADTVDLKLQFIVVTEYFEPDYDFDYPEEYLIRMEPISFPADFGKTYHVTITGDKANGYKARLEDDR